MNRIQLIAGVGLFLIVALFGWRSYLEKAAHKNRTDARGLPTQLVKDIEDYRAKHPSAPGSETMPVPKVEPSKESQ